MCGCGTELPAGTRAGWDRSARHVVCEGCLSAAAESLPAAAPAADLDTAADVEPDSSQGAAAPSAPIRDRRAGARDDMTQRHAPPGLPRRKRAASSSRSTSGARARRLEQEYQRRKQAREDRIRGKHPRLGGLILALSDEPATTKAFATGADGERRIAARLEKDCGADVLFLHNRKLGHGRRDGDVDHVAVAPSGIYVIDAKRYQNAAVRVRRTGGLLSPVKEQLMVAGRDRTKLIDGCAKQLARRCRCSRGRAGRRGRARDRAALLRGCGPTALG